MDPDRCDGRRQREQDLLDLVFWMVPVTGEDGRRTIAVLEAAERSARSGKTEPVEYE